MIDINNESDFLFFNSNNGDINIPIIIGDETIWATQKNIANIFEVNRTVITKHIQNIFNVGELSEESNVQKLHIANSDKLVSFYNLDVILSVGYRVNSYKATQFRIWASKTLKEYLIKGFALDDIRLKQGNRMFGKDYFEELLQRIREIRSSERRFYQKITDLYALSVDYDVQSPTTKVFFAQVQNKLEFAITHNTAAEIIKKRADAKLPHMGLTTWSNSPKGKIIKKDVTIAKNYLNQEEIDELNRIVNMYLDYAENQAKKNRLMKMKDWIDRLDLFLRFNEYEILDNAGTISKQIADDFAESEYTKFRIIQDKEYKSDFDNVVEGIITKSELPKESESLKKDKQLSDFDEKLKKGLKFNPKDNKKNK